MISGNPDYEHPKCEFYGDGLTVNLIIDPDRHFWADDLKALRKMLKRVEKQLESGSAGL